MHFGIGWRRFGRTGFRLFSGMATFRYPVISTLLLSQRYPVTASLLLAEVVEADFKTAKKKFEEAGTPTEQIKEYFDQFKALKSRIKEDTDRDIDRWAKQGWEKFKSFVDELKGTKSKKQAKKLAVQEGAKLIAENESWKVYHITGFAASRKLGHNNWCIVRDETQWGNYVTKNNVYFIISNKVEPAPGEEAIPLAPEPWTAIALLVDLDGDKTYWDDQDKPHASLPEDLPPLPEFDAEIPELKIVVNGKAYGLEELKERATKDPEIAKGLLLQNIFGHDAQFQKVELGDEEIAVGFYLEELIENLPGVSRKASKHLQEILEDHYDYNWNMKDQDVDSFFDSIEKSHPKTYQKIQQDIHKIGEVNDDDYHNSRQPGEWFKNYGDELPEIQQALFSAISDGWSVGTADAAHEYVKSILESTHWMGGGSITEGEQGLMWLNVPYTALSDDYGLGDMTTSLDRRDGFESEFNEEVAEKRFYEVLHQEGYAVD